MKLFLDEKLKLVVLDQELSVVRIATKMLQAALKDYFELTAFTDPSEARHWLAHSRADLLLSGSELPGVEAIEMLRFAKRQNPWTQVIFMTDHFRWDRITELVEAGASNYLVKPLNRDELLTVVEQESIRSVRWQQALKETPARQQRELV